MQCLSDIRDSGFRIQHSGIRLRTVGCFFKLDILFNLTVLSSGVRKNMEKASRQSAAIPKCDGPSNVSHVRVADNCIIFVFCRMTLSSVRRQKSVANRLYGLRTLPLTCVFYLTNIQKQKPPFLPTFISSYFSMLSRTRLGENFANIITSIRCHRRAKANSNTRVICP